MFRNKSNMTQHFDKAKLLVTEITLVFAVGRGDIIWHDAIQNDPKKRKLFCIRYSNTCDSPVLKKVGLDEWINTRCSEVYKTRMVLVTLGFSKVLLCNWIIRVLKLRLNISSVPVYMTNILTVFILLNQLVCTTFDFDVIRLATRNTTGHLIYKTLTTIFYLSNSLSDPKNLGW